MTARGPPRFDDGAQKYCRRTWSLGAVASAYARTPGRVRRLAGGRRRAAQANQSAQACRPDPHRPRRTAKARGESPALGWPRKLPANTASLGVSLRRQTATTLSGMLRYEVAVDGPVVLPIVPNEQPLNLRKFPRQTLKACGACVRDHCGRGDKADPNRSGSTCCMPSPPGGSAAGGTIWDQLRRVPLAGPAAGPAGESGSRAPDAGRPTGTACR